MRSILLLFIIMIVTPSALIMPHLGVLVWTWLSVMNPHRLSWGFTFDMPFVMVIAVVTLVAWQFSREPKLPPSRLLTWTAFAFIIHATVTTFLALHPEESWVLWDRVVKKFVLFFAVVTLINTRVRIQALLWIIAISLGFFSTKGVMDTLASGGTNVLTGPPDTPITDNNHLALSLVVLLPILNYLRSTSVNKLVRLAVIAVVVFTLVAIITSYSRGALVALMIGAFAFLRSTRGRIVLLAIVVLVSVFVINVMPEKWKDRVTTLESVETIQEDESFSGRTDAWTVSWRLAMSRPLTGGGFSAIERPETFLRFMPEATRGRAAHSIYFQVLGDHGFVGLAMYLTMFACVWFHLRRTRSRSRLHPGLAWADELAKMMQVAVLTFMVGGAALSVAYFDLILLIFAVSMNLDIVTDRATRKPVQAFLSANHEND